MIIFHSDLDSTLIYSDKNDIGSEKILLEEYESGATYITKKTFDGLVNISEKILTVPTTTRSEKLYNRINWQGCTFKYALVANGAILLENGKASEVWRKETQKLLEPAKDELARAEHILNTDKRRTRDIDIVDEAFLFTKVSQIDDVVSEIEEKLDLSKVTIRTYKNKLYVLPKSLEKGAALMRFRRYIAEKERIDESDILTVAAGDGDFDISMIEEANIGIANYKLKIPPKKRGKILFLGENGVFSDEVLTELQRIISPYQV